MSKVLSVFYATAAEWTDQDPIVPLGWECVESDTFKRKLGTGVDKYSALGHETGDGTGTVTSVASANGAATIATPTTTPVITIVSAPILTTARAIGGVNFDGSAAINPGVPVTNKSAAYTFALVDANTTIYHPASDANARAWVIPANGTIAFPIGTAITLINDSANDVTVTITTDVLNYANVGAITTLTIPRYNQATIYKVAAAQWNANGSAGCTTA